MRRKHLVLLLFLMGLAALLFGCGGTSHGGGGGIGNGAGKNTNAEKTTKRTTLTTFLMPEASGELTASKADGTIVLDYSHTEDGYVMICYTGEAAQLQIQVTNPDGTVYPYPMSAKDEYKAFPLTGGDGEYKLSILEEITDGRYAIGLTQNFSVTLVNEFSPFLYPSQYVDYTPQSACVAKGMEISDQSADDLDYVNEVYAFVTSHVSYDTELASNLPVNYVPNPDATLASGTGICFDYASLMTAMLRSQGIPTKLEVGYAGTVYHAWISVYLEDIGWVDNIIEFDGTDWTLMDPTLGSGNDRRTVEQYMKNGEYTVKYHY